MIKILDSVYICHGSDLIWNIKETGDIYSHSERSNLLILISPSLTTKAPLIFCNIGMMAKLIQCFLAVKYLFCTNQLLTLKAAELRQQPECLLTLSSFRNEVLNLFSLGIS